MRKHFARNRMTRFGTVAIIAVGALFASANPAAAGSAPDPASDPLLRAVGEVAWTTGPDLLTHQDFVQRAPAAEKAAAAVAAAAATNCWTFNDYRSGTNIYGGTLYTFHTQTNWCGDGSWVRQWAYTNADGTAAFTWKYYGLIQSYDEYGVNWNRFHSVREGQFCLGNCIIQNEAELNDVLVGPAGEVFHA